MNAPALTFFSPSCLFLFITASCLLSHRPVDATYTNDFHVTWGPDNVKSMNKDHVWQLMLDNVTACGMGSNKSYLFGSFSMYMKLVRGNSAGTVTAFYFYSETTDWDELDFEFLGNVSGQPYLLQTNVFWNGTGGREQRVLLWFDPSAGYHNYTVLWNPQQIIFMVDGVPIRVVSNNEAIGIPFLNKQSMRMFASIWDGSTWATRGGQDKIAWARAPFIASFGKYKFDACLASKTSCPKNKWWNSAQFHTLSDDQQSQFAQVKQNYMVYNYCTDRGRYPDIPAEC